MEFYKIDLVSNLIDSKQRNVDIKNSWGLHTGERILQESKRTGTMVLQEVGQFGIIRADVGCMVYVDGVWFILSQVLHSKVMRAMSA